MLLVPLLSGVLETSLNVLLFRDKQSKAVVYRLSGKTLRLSLAGFSSAMTLVFSAQRIDIQTQWNGDIDCSISTQLSTLIELKDRKKLAAFIRHGDVIVDGDLQIAQQFIHALELVDWDWAEWLAPYIGDIAAEGLVRTLNQGIHLFKQTAARHHRYLSEALTEEWQIAPNALEIAYFQDEVSALAQDTASLDARLNRLDVKR